MSAGKPVILWVRYRAGEFKTEGSIYTIPVRTSLWLMDFSVMFKAAFVPREVSEVHL